MVGVSTQMILVRPGSHRGSDGCDVGEVRGGPLQTPRRGDLGDQAVGAAVRVVGDHHMITGSADRTQQRVLGGHAGGERQPTRAALEGGQALLQRRPGRVGRAAVLVAAAQPAHAVLAERRRRVDRRHDGARRGVGVLPGMDRQRLEPGRVARRIDVGLPEVFHP